MTTTMMDQVSLTAIRLLAEAAGSTHAEEAAAMQDELGSTVAAEEEHFGVHITFADLYAVVVFLAAVYAVGLSFSSLLGLPALVGEIFVGILMGPDMFNVVPHAEAMVLIGEIGLVLLVLEAGLDIDLTTLRLIGSRGTLIALVGSALPVALALGVAYALGYSGTTAVAAACVFAPTSLGIATNVLRRAGMINTPTGQLIRAAAIIEDMVALVILSQLEAFTKESVSVVDMLIPIISALGFLFVGGGIAIFLLPKPIEEFILNPLANTGKVNRDWASLALMFLFLLLLLPITYDLKASPLMGAFLAGLAFCSNKGAHHMFVSQFKRLMQWLMRIFFAASIGFQVPFHKFGNWNVIVEALFFTTALLGKVAVGFMLPNFWGSNHFNYTHLRDCLIVGFTMTAEGEFASVIAVFGVSHAMIPKDLYASVILAVLLSMIIGPFFLQRTIAYFNKRIENDVFGRDRASDPNSALVHSIRENTAVFWCIQTRSAPAWGLLTGIVRELTKLNLDVIDHRSWHPRRSDDTLLNEIYVKDDSLSLDGIDTDEAEHCLKERKGEVKALLSALIKQPNATIRVQRWVPQIAHDDDDAILDVTKHIERATKDALKASMFKHKEHPTPTRDVSRSAESLTSSVQRRSTDGLQRRASGGTRSNHRRIQSHGPGHHHHHHRQRSGGDLAFRVIQIGPLDAFFAGKMEGLIRCSSFHHHSSDASSDNAVMNHGGYNGDYNDDSEDEYDMQHVDSDDDSGDDDDDYYDRGQDLASHTQSTVESRTRSYEQLSLSSQHDEVV